MIEAIGDGYSITHPPKELVTPQEALQQAADRADGYDCIVDVREYQLGVRCSRREYIRKHNKLPRIKLVGPVTRGT